jgi:starch-binding outer membrane protein, SusD/RagB family
MKLKIDTSIFYLGLSLVVAISSCKKENDWLDVKQNLSEIVPTTIKDFQGVLDNEQVMNKVRTLALLGTDDYYVSYTDWLGRNPIEKNAYMWASDILQGQSDATWNSYYQIVEYANIVLDGIGKISPAVSEQLAWNNVKGSALFFRANAFFYLASVYAKPYIAGSASTDLGIPIRISSDIHGVSTRSSLSDTYQQIIDDLKNAESLLETTALYQTRPTKLAAQALLARVYLSMQDYPNAELYANLVLNSYNKLFDFSQFPTQTFPIPAYPANPEILFFSYGQDFSIATLNGRSIVDSTLFNSYNANDLRRAFFYISSTKKFRGTQTTKGTFNGIATNEIYLIRAETYIRRGNISGGLNDLNALLSKRYKSNTYTPYTTTIADSALVRVLNERRKELPFTNCVRWTDLRRLNLDSRFAKTLARNLNSQIYTLSPNDSRYVYPIPIDEIKLSGIEQNPR